MVHEDRNLWIAASDGDLEGVRAFLDEGVGMDVNAQDENGYSCMHAAASYGHLDLLRYLVQRGGDVNIRDPDGDTPLHVCEDVATAQALVGCGADPQATNADGQRPHEAAAENGFLELANYLRGLSGLQPLTQLPEAEAEAEADIVADLADLHGLNTAANEQDPQEEEDGQEEGAAMAE